MVPNQGITYQLNSSLLQWNINTNIWLSIPHINPLFSSIQSIINSYYGHFSSYKSYQTSWMCNATSHPKKVLLGPLVLPKKMIKLVVVWVEAVPHTNRGRSSSLWLQRLRTANTGACMCYIPILTRISWNFWIAKTNIYIRRGSDSRSALRLLVL